MGRAGHGGAVSRNSGISSFQITRHGLTSWCCRKSLTAAVPFLKFFLKKELIWVPILGIAWWALDFPFMKRYSAAVLKKRPHLRGKDIEITRQACKKFKSLPVSIMNFVEGTRFTREKHDKQKSPFTHLLKPKAGGIGFVLSTMGEQLQQHSERDDHVSRRRYEILELPVRQDQGDTGRCGKTAPYPGAARRLCRRSEISGAIPGMGERPLDEERCAD